MIGKRCCMHLCKQLWMIILLRKNWLQRGFQMGRNLMKFEFARKKMDYPFLQYIDCPKRNSISLFGKLLIFRTWKLKSTTKRWNRMKRVESHIT